MFPEVVALFRKDFDDEYKKFREQEGVSTDEAAIVDAMPLPELPKGEST